ncbi:unnamed protein product, partial [Phaeothamnion confervicola]
LLPAPDRGCPCFVLRTGFETSQGQLMRTILFASERVTAGSNAETTLFVLILLLFALVAAGYVLADGLRTQSRNRFQLLLRCIMIVTSVVPPELPMELSLAVTNSLAALMDLQVFCTEPFRIPLAGKVDVCCFDKTGTLTSDNFVLKGVAAPCDVDSPPAYDLVAAVTRGGDHVSGAATAAAASAGTAAAAAAGAMTKIKRAKSLGPAVLRVLAGCHSVTVVDGVAVGDPLELAALEGIRWRLCRPPGGSAHSGGGGGSGGTVLVPDALVQSNPENVPIRIVHTFAFDPRLRRMSAFIVRADDVLQRLNGAWHATAAAAATAPASPTATGAAAVAAAKARPPFDGRVWVVCKGAPEALEPLLVALPAHYRATYLYHMGRGRRVLALGFKALAPGVSAAAARGAGRAEAERGLTFAGFLIVTCPIKPDTAGVLADLQASSHRTVMITGDGALTAADVARRVGIVVRPPAQTLVLVEGDGGGGGGTASGRLTWLPLTAGEAADDGGKAGNSTGSEGGRDGGGGGKSGRIGGHDAGCGGVALDLESIGELAQEYSLCVTGAALARLVGGLRKGSSGGKANGPGNGSGSGSDRNWAKALAVTATMTGNVDAHSHAPWTLPPVAMAELSQLCAHVSVFARVSPEQKEAVIAALNAGGATTLMCGDGTNDVGALKRAHVGVSIMNCPELEKRLQAHSDHFKERAKMQVRQANNGGDNDGGGANGGGGCGGGSDSGGSGGTASGWALMEAEVREQNRNPLLVRFGDASIASPFTARTTSVGCVLAIVRQGRCTLVTTLQVYTILALNCLTSAYVLSAVHLRGARQGDGQMAILGLTTAALFFCTSRARPLDHLSARRPAARIFCAEVLLPIVAQFAVHLVCLVAMLRFFSSGGGNGSSGGDAGGLGVLLSLDGPFRPSAFNTAVFLLSGAMQLNTFAANYTGHPFM